ncbi:MAG: MMPL family transporter, partial [Deltaproteobacteria bacterium]|nr:MMPL family transporter [Deltaproteobacteria bacterium]
MLESLMARFNRLVCRHPYATLLLGLVATIVSLVASQRLTLKTDFVDLLPQELPSVQALHSLQQEFGGSRYHTIIIEHQNRDAAIRFMQDFSQKIAVLPQVFYLETEKPARFFERRALWYLTKDELQSVDERIQTYVSQHKLGASPFWGQMLNLTDEAAPLDFSDIEQKYAKQFGLGEGNAVGSIYYENADQTLLAFLVKPKDDAVGLSESRKFLQEMKTIEQNLSPKSYDSSIRVGYTGDYQMLIDQHHYISQEIFKITLIVLIALCVVVFLYYSRLSSLILLFIPLVLSMIWAAGLTSVSLGSINIITSLSGCVLLGLGSDYGIYLLDRFYQERKQGLSVEEACAHAFSKTGRATFAAFLTTAAAYVALMLARFKAFSEFGWIGILGIGMSLFAMFTVLPALICIAEKHRLFAFEQHWSLKLIPTLALKKLLPPLPVLGVFAVLMVGTFFSAAPLSMEYDTDKMTSYNFKLETKELEEKADQIFDYKLRPSVFVAENAEHEHEILTALNKRAAEKPDLFYRIFALDSLLPKEQASKYNLMRQIQNHWKKIPSEVIRKKYTNIFDPDF